MTFQKVTTPSAAAAIVTLVANGKSVTEVAVRYNISRSTVKRLLAFANPKPPRELLPCGTNAAYVRHKRLGTRPCPACCEAHAAYQRAWRLESLRRENQRERRSA